MTCYTQVEVRSIVDQSAAVAAAATEASRAEEGTSGARVLVNRPALAGSVVEFIRRRERQVALSLSQLPGLPLAPNNKPPLGAEPQPESHEGGQREKAAGEGARGGEEGEGNPAGNHLLAQTEEAVHEKERARPRAEQGALQKPGGEMGKEGTEQVVVPVPKPRLAGWGFDGAALLQMLGEEQRKLKVLCLCLLVLLL